MSRSAPDQLLLSWLCSLPKRHREILVGRYIFMTCRDSADLVLCGDEAWQYFRRQLLDLDFPLRRVARLLMARVLLTFLLDRNPADDHESNLADDSIVTSSLDVAQYLRAKHYFRELTETDLSDVALHEWLLMLQEKMS